MFKTTKGWQKTTEGLIKQLSDTRFVIEQQDSGWRLVNRLDNGKGSLQEKNFLKLADKKIWQSFRIEECFQAAILYEDYLQKKSEFFSTRLFSKKILTENSGNAQKALEAIELVVRRTREGDITVKAWHPNNDKQEIGYLSTEYTGFHATYALGEFTTNSASYIDKQWRGKGLCAEMYNFQQEVLGIPPVPHGKNLVEGDQSIDAKFFWQKRSKHHRVPGLDDPEVLDKVNKIAPMLDVFNMESSESVRYNPQLMIVLGYHLNAQTLCFRENYGQEGIDKGDIVLSACVLEDSSIFAGLGKTSKQALLEELHEYSDRCEVEVLEPNQLLTELTLYIRDNLDWSEFENSVLLQEPVAERILLATGLEPKLGFKDYLEGVTRNNIGIRF